MLMLVVSFWAVHVCVEKTVLLFIDIIMNDIGICVFVLDARWNKDWYIRGLFYLFSHFEHKVKSKGRGVLWSG